MVKITGIGDSLKQAVEFSKVLSFGNEYKGVSFKRKSGECTRIC